MDSDSEVERDIHADTLFNISLIRDTSKFIFTSTSTSSLSVLLSLNPLLPTILVLPSQDLSPSLLHTSPQLYSPYPAYSAVGLGLAFFVPSKESSGMVPLGGLHIVGPRLSASTEYAHALCPLAEDVELEEQLGRDGSGVGCDIEAHEQTILGIVMC